MIPTPHTIDVLSPTLGTDRRGDQSEDWTAPSELAGLPAFVQPSSGQELNTSAGTRLVFSHTLFCLHPALTASDRVRWRSQVYLVVGTPRHHETPSGYHHTEADLRLVRG